MGAKSSIEWTDATWNPTTGCTRVSPGCENCYAEKIAHRFRDMPEGHKLRGLTTERGRWNGTVLQHHDRLDQPLRWTERRRIFVDSMSDLFHESVEDDFIAMTWAFMAYARQHTFQILTKRAERLHRLLNDERWQELFHDHCAGAAAVAQEILERRGEFSPLDRRDGDIRTFDPQLPLSNVWLGVSVENQETADERIPLLLQTPAAVRLISYEPALERVDFSNYMPGSQVPWAPGHAPSSWSAFDWPAWVPARVREEIESFHSSATARGPAHYEQVARARYNRAPAFGELVTLTIDAKWNTRTGRYVHAWNNIGRVVDEAGASHVVSTCDYSPPPRLNQIIVGGESGAGARPFNLAWARSVVQECRAAGVACFVKQLGSRPYIVESEESACWFDQGGIRFGALKRWFWVAGKWHFRPADRKGGDLAEFPMELAVREFPEVRT